MNRILKCHSVRLRDVVTYSIIRALEYLDTYVRFEKSEKGREIISSILDNVITILSKDELDLKECLSVLNNILTEWRMYFIRFMEVRIKREEWIGQGKEEFFMTKCKSAERFSISDSFHQRVFWLMETEDKDET